jgi:hypothetical protein
MKDKLLMATFPDYENIFPDLNMNKKLSIDENSELISYDMKGNIDNGNDSSIKDDHHNELYSNMNEMKSDSMIETVHHDENIIRKRSLLDRMRSFLKFSS